MTRADLILIAAVAIMLPAVYLATWQDVSAGSEIVIRSADREPVILPLNQDREVRVGGRMGDSVIEIHDGKAHFLHSPCTSKVCIHSGWLDETGDFAACLPNGVSFTVAGGERRFDAVNF